MNRRARVAKIVDAIFDRFLRPGPVPGTWIDHYQPDWSLIADKVPATSLYHVTLAFWSCSGFATHSLLLPHAELTVF